MKTVAIVGHVGTIEVPGSGRVALSDWTLTINAESLRDWAGSFHLRHPGVPIGWHGGEVMIELVTEEQPPAIWSGAVSVTQWEDHPDGAVVRFEGANQLSRREKPR